MDRENADREPADLALVETLRADAPSGPTLVSVCITCKTADGATVGPDMFEAVKAAMDAAGLKPDIAEVTMRADNDIAVSGETAQQVAKLLRWLEDLDDVQNVYSNADLGDAAYA